MNEDLSNQNLEDDDDMNDSDIDDNALAVATKGDSNGINNMITDLYKKSNDDLAKRKGTLNTAYKSAENDGKRVQFTETAATESSNKRKLPSAQMNSANNSNNTNKMLKITENMTNSEKLDVLKQSSQQQRRSSSGASNKKGS